MTQNKGVIISQGVLNNLPRCPYRQDLQLFCFEERCDKAGCPVYEKESGLLAEALNQRE